MMHKKPIIGCNTKLLPYYFSVKIKSTKSNDINKTIIK